MMMMMLGATHPENPATEAQLSWPIALFGSPSPQFTNCHEEDYDYDDDNDDDVRDVSDDDVNYNKTM